MALDTAAETAPTAAARLDERGPDRGRLALLATGHAVTDSYGQSLLAPMFPDIARRLSLSLDQVGALPMMMGLSASLAQPLLGWLADRYPRVCWVAIGPVVAALCIGFVGHAHSFALLAVVLFAAGIGIGAYHPQGATLARLAGRGSGLAMSAFTVGGNLGFGAAPLLGALYLQWFGLERLHFAAVPALLFAAVMLTTFHAPAACRERREAMEPEGRSYPWALAALTGTVVVRSAVQIGMMTFLPFLVEQRFPVEEHASVRAIGVSAFLLASAVSGPLGGLLSDLFGRRALMAGSFLLAPWPMLAAFSAPGYGMLALLSLGAAILMLPHPGNVVMAQELMPKRAGIAASMITGLAWGVAQILALPLGTIARHSSLSAALIGLSLVPLLGVLLVLPLPRQSRR